MQNNRWGIALYDEVYINKKRRKWSFRSLHILRCRHVKCLLHCIFVAKVQKNPLLPTKGSGFFFRSRHQVFLTLQAFYRLCINGVWYEHEGFVSDKPKRAFSNMLNHGLRQSSRIIIDRPNLTDAYMKRNINQRVKEGQIIDEIWINDDSSIRLFYKKF